MNPELFLKVAMVVEISDQFTLEEKKDVLYFLMAECIEEGENAIIKTIGAQYADVATRLDTIIDGIRSQIMEDGMRAQELEEEKYQTLRS